MLMLATYLASTIRDRRCENLDRCERPFCLCLADCRMSDGVLIMCDVRVIMVEVIDQIMNADVDVCRQIDADGVARLASPLDMYSLYVRRTG